MDALNRRAYDGHGSPAPGPNIRDTPSGSKATPSRRRNVEADNMIIASGETYNFFYRRVRPRLVRRQRRDHGRHLQPRLTPVPNASWNGTFISFCPGSTTDDVTAPRVGPRLHAIHARPHLRVAAGRSERVVFGHLGRDGRPASTAAHDRQPGRLAHGRHASSHGIHTPAADSSSINRAGRALPGPTWLTRLSAAPTHGRRHDRRRGSRRRRRCAGADDGCQRPLRGNAGRPRRARSPSSTAASCGFPVKAYNAQQNGAIGVIIANNAPTGTSATWARARMRRSSRFPRSA